MCNLYSMRKSRDELLRLFRIARADEEIPQNMPAIFPDAIAPIVRLDETGSRHLTKMRWGFPPPPKGSRPVTNIRNTDSPYWRNWLRPEYRCLVPATSFCEWTDMRPKVPHWFALREERPLFAFAGLWRPWRGERKGRSGEHLLYAFLTTEANDLVRPIHAKAMPVILSEEEAWDRWLTGSVEEALKLQFPLAPMQLGIVTRGEVEDRG
ncbi:MAG TPA: SOS response-associated peptidase [Aestuariivirgaceae bacterium]|jgi:putative SOS response-associated peptidase YedK